MILTLTLPIIMMHMSNESILTAQPGRINSQCMFLFSQKVPYLTLVIHHVAPMVIVLQYFSVEAVGITARITAIHNGTAFNRCWCLRSGSGWWKLLK